MKKLTLKQFNEALKEVGMNPEIYDLAAILNELSYFLSSEAEAVRANGNDNLARLYQERSDGIYDYLNNLGYYDKCRMWKG